MTALTVVPALAAAPPPITLYQIEEQLQCLFDSAELVAPEQEAEFMAELSHALATAVEKRQRVAEFLAHCQSQIVLAQAERRRLSLREDMYERVVERVQQCVINTIVSLGAPGPKGKMTYPKLEGRTVSFSIRHCPPSVEILDELKVPATYKTLTVKLPSTVWDQIIDSLPPDDREWALGQVAKAETVVSKEAIKTAISAKKEVPGARICDGRFSLCLK